MITKRTPAPKYAIALGSASIYLLSTFPALMIAASMTFLAISIIKPGELFLFGRAVTGILAIILVSFISYIASKNSNWGALRDLYYIAIFLSALYIGFFLSKRGTSIELVVTSSAIALIVQSLIYLVNFALEFKNYQNINALRDAVGQNSSLVFAIIFPLLPLLGKKLRITFMLATLASFINFSRSNVITAALFISNLNINKKLLSLFLLVPCLVLITSFLPEQLTSSYIAKFSTTIDEVLNQNVSDSSELNERWRAYERFIVALELANGDSLQKLFGFGLGATAYSDFPKRTDSSSSDYIDEIPVFHDSILFISLKSGYIGIFAWIFFWAVIIKNLYASCKALKAEAKLQKPKLLLFTFILVLGINAFSHGYPFMTKVGVETIILGYLLQHHKQRKTTHS